MSLHFDLHSVGVLAPGVGSLAELLSLCRTGAPAASEPLVLPAPTVLPANERRRASRVVRLTLACAQQALRDSPFAADRLRSVFASDEGTGEVCQQMLDAQATAGLVSPLLFHNSVHNAPSGYFSIAYQNCRPSVSVSMGRESFAGGLLCAASETCASGEPVLFLAYESPLPEPIRTLLPIEQATASAWVIAPSRAGPATPGGAADPATRAPLASFELSLRPAAAQDGEDAPPAWLPLRWRANSSARGFAVLALLADGRGSCEFQLGAQRLRVALVAAAAPC